MGDVVAGVKYLIDTGRVDGNRAAIRGGSAGGFTVLATLAFHNVFKAGANYYGVSDLEALARDTHKFESRYLDRLVAPLPEGRAIYEARAPIRHLENFKAALITFQGSEDKVVPPDQSRAIVAALKAKGVPVAYIEFEGEQHGFRKAENIVRSLESELGFYGTGVWVRAGWSAPAGATARLAIAHLATAPARRLALPTRLPETSPPPARAWCASPASAGNRRRARQTSPNSRRR